mmetsp:Transcript_136/g.136  ORF Transcript_136/g.136 Transcript_136/m.136 type:complete len:104 (-) Transcript_136:1437-1748(-)
MCLARISPLNDLKYFFLPLYLFRFRLIKHHEGTSNIGALHYSCSNTTRMYWTTCKLFRHGTQNKQQGEEVEEGIQNPFSVYYRSSFQLMIAKGRFIHNPIQIS